MKHTRHVRFAIGASALALAMAAGGAAAQNATPAEQKAAPAAAAASTMTQPQIKAALEAKGYTKVHDIEFDNGMWEAEAESADGRNVDVRIDPRTGEIYPDDGVSELGEADIRARLAAAGYTKVRDVKFDDGMWKAEADDTAGNRMELRLDPKSGEIVGKDRD